MNRCDYAKMAVAPTAIGLVAPLVIYLRNQMPESFRYSTVSVLLQCFAALGISVPFILIAYHALETWSKRRQ